MAIRATFGVTIDVTVRNFDSNKSLKWAAQSRSGISSIAFVSKILDTFNHLRLKKNIDTI